MRIVAINAGDKGHALLDRWSANGHDTDGTSFDAIVEMNQPIQADVILLDLGDARVDDIAMFARHLDGKVIIDCSNVKNVPELRSGSASIAEQVAQACPRASVVKALNVITFATLQRVFKRGGAESRSGYVSGYYCGDDEQARRTAAGLIEEAQLEPSDCGPLSNATLLEALGLLTHHLEKHAASGPHFTISIVRAHDDSSPLDRWM
ncbi:MAG: hypothetical protein GIX01_01995 [Candidatus Eremiobacteraeota bacterium]|nr:hypothetical protein [Candidatus Eremiobacteraeota bacterium]